MNCKICSSSAGINIVAKDNGTGNSFNYWQCDSCQVVFLQQIPESYEKYYSSNYYSFVEDDAKSLISFIKQKRDAFHLKNSGFAGGILGSLIPNYNLQALQLLQLKPSDILLDIGCGIGKEIRSLKQNGFNYVHGIDPYITNDIFLNNELLVAKKDIDELEGHFDVITMHHSFEHMKEPLQVLQKLYRHLSASGRIMIRIPVADSYAYQKFGTSWVQFDAPRHIFLHTKKSIALLAEQTGFIIDNFFSDSSSFQFWGTGLNKKGYSIHSVPKRKIFLSKLASVFKGESRFAKSLNKQGKGDQAIFILRKA